MISRTNALIGGRTKSPCVLVVEHDRSLRAYFRTALEAAGFATLEAASGLEGLDVIERGAISAVVLHVSPGGLSDVQVVTTIRSQAETATLPILLVADGDTAELVDQGLEAGANDFLTQPVRVDELVTRIRGMVRSHEAWTDRLRENLRERSAVVEALGQLDLLGSPEDVAEAVVMTLVTHTHAEYVALHQVAGVGEVRPLAQYHDGQGLRVGLPPMEPRQARALLDRANSGPWTDVAGRDMTNPSEGLARQSLAAVARAPVYAHGRRMAGLLVLGFVAGSTPARSVAVSPERLSRLLSAAIDYASILSTLAGEQIAGNAQARASRASLEHILAERTFATVFQPIVQLPDRSVVGYEALTRFDDGVRPDVRFREAEGAGLGMEFEAATMERALITAATLPTTTMLTLNASADFVLSGDQLADLLARAARPIVLEITEHSRIDDYDALRSALGALDGGIRVAVDDAGAGFSSLRHILELQPAFAKLDMSLVQGIERDTVRQALVTGLDYFARRSNCSLIAEGVETAAEAATLERLGVGLAQGYLFGRPAALT